jgi:hypothetical protein
MTSAKQPAPFDPKDTDSLPFEITDLASARAALDELPAGVGRLGPRAPDWSARRRKLGPSDRALQGSTIDWMLALPPSLRPKELCERFPRVANGLAAVWHDPVRRHAMLADLLEDRRGKRAGFPPRVRAEIEALR